MPYWNSNHVVSASLAILFARFEVEFTSNVRVGAMANLKAEFHGFHLTCPSVKHDEEMSIFC